MKVVKKIIGFLRWLLGLLGVLASVRRDGGCAKPEENVRDETQEESSDVEEDGCLGQ